MASDLERIATIEGMVKAHSYLVMPRARREGFDRVHVRGDGEAWRRGAVVTVIWSIAYELDDRPWLHASIARPDRIPSYAEMLRLHMVFIGPERYAYEVRAPRSKHVNVHANCLHMWAVFDGGPEPLPDFTQGHGTI